VSKKGRGVMLPRKINEDVEYTDGVFNHSCIIKQLRYEPYMNLESLMNHTGGKE